MPRQLPVVSASQIGDLDDPSLPIIAQLASVDTPHRIEPHAHRRGQLVYASHGSLQVKSRGPIFMVPPQFAIWIPPQVSHSVTAGMPIDYCSLFVDESVKEVLPNHPQLLHLTPILRELTTTAVDAHYDSNPGPRARLNAVILDQLQMLRPARVALPIPSSDRMNEVVDFYLQNPEAHLDLRELAQRFAMSERTLTRHFKSETGLNLSQWLQHLKALKAIEMLEAGESVKAAAFEVGYQQPSAFISMFKRVTGHTPNRYVPRI